MPTYLVHGFRWPRSLIRIHIILQNLDDAAAEWLMAPLTGQTLVQNFTQLYPTIMPSLPNLRFIEQYDPLDESGDSKSQPYAYVADYVHEVKLGIDVDEMRAKGISNETWSAMVELRDKLAPGEKLSWFVVVCGDVERWAPPEGSSLVANGATNGLNGHAATNGPLSAGSASEDGRRGSTEPSSTRPSTSRSLRRFFSTKNLRKSRSMKSLASRKGSTDASAMSPPPPLPPQAKLLNSTHQAQTPGTAV